MGHYHDDHHQGDDRATGVMFTGILGGLIGYVATNIALYAKMLPFDREVAKRTREDILGRGGIGAGIAESMGFGAGAGRNIIEEAHQLNLIQEKEFSFAKRVMQMGGRSMVSLIGAAIGAVGAGVWAMKAFKSRRPEAEAIIHDAPSRRMELDIDQPVHETKNWKETVQKEAVTEQREASL